MVLYRKRGCPRCGQTGYRGRIGIFQMLQMNEALARARRCARRSRDEIEREAMASGMRTLWDDGMAKVAAGLTSIEELARVTRLGRSAAPSLCLTPGLALRTKAR